MGSKFGPQTLYASWIIANTLFHDSQTNELAWNNLPAHWNFTLFYTIWNFCELLFVWFFYIETKGPTLEEVAWLFDGDDAVAKINLSLVEKETSLVRAVEYMHGRDSIYE